MEDTKKILEKMDEIDEKITSVQITLENEIRNNIQLIAEGHIDLERKLDEALCEDKNQKERCCL